MASLFGNKYRFPQQQDPMDPWNRVNSITNQPYGSWSEMPYKTSGQETKVQTGVENTSGRKQVTSEQGVDVLPEDKYLELKARLAQDPEYQRAVSAVEALDKINMARLNAPAQMDISPLGNAASVIFDDPRLAQVAQKRPSSVDELDALQKGAAGSVEGYQRLASIGDAFLGRQLSTKVKNELVEQEGVKDTTQRTDAVESKATNIAPRAAGGKAKPIDLTKLGDRYSKFDNSVNAAQAITSLVPDAFNSEFQDKPLPGFGGAAGKLSDLAEKGGVLGFIGDVTQSVALNENERAVRQAIKSLEADVRKGLYGSTLTGNELQSFQEQMGKGLKNNDGASIRKALVIMGNALKRKARTAETSLPEQTAQWRNIEGMTRSEEIDMILKNKLAPKKEKTVNGVVQPDTMQAPQKQKSMTEHIAEERAKRKGKK